MNDNLYNLLYNDLIKKDGKERGKKINKLIECKVIDLDYTINELIKHGDSSLFINFIKYIEGLNIEKLTDGIITSEDAKFIYLFAMNIKGADLKKLTKAIIETGDEEYNVYFFKNVEGLDKDEYIKCLCDSKDAYLIYNFAKHIKGKKYIDMLTEGIIKTNNLDCIIVFAKEVRDADVDKLTDAIIKSKNSECIYIFARDVQGANIEKLTDAIIECGDARYIYLFAKNVVGVNKNILFDKLISLKAVSFAIDSLKTIDNINGECMDKLINFVLEYGNKSAIEAISDIMKDRKEVIEQEKMKKLLFMLDNNQDDEIKEDAESFSKLFIDEEETVVKKLVK